MKWEIEHNKKDGIVVVKTSGLITWDDNLLMTQKALAAAQNSPHRRFSLTIGYYRPT